MRNWSTGHISRHNNVVHKAGQRRDATDEECDNSTPVAPEFRRVAIDTVEVIHVGYGDVATANDVVIRDEDACHGAEENGVSAQESEEFRGGRENFPGHESPAADDGGEELTTAGC